MATNVYKMDEYSWYASNLDFEDTVKWYQNNIDSLDEDQIEEIEVCDIENDGMWYITTDDADLLRIGDNEKMFEEVKNETHHNKFGDLVRSGHGVYKFMSFADVIKIVGEITQPFEIANTEW